MYKKGLFATLIMVGILCTGCGQKEKTTKYMDGYYTAEASDFDDHGWIEYLTICVSNGKIISAELNARNESGLIKAWDMNYMKTMNSIVGTYPNYYTRALTKSFLEQQTSEGIQAVTGASHSSDFVKELAAAVLDSALRGDETVVRITPTA